MQLKFYILIFSIFNFLAFGCLLVYKFVNAPETVRIERTSVMSSSEKKELVAAVLDIVTNGNFYSLSSPSSSSEYSRPTAVQGAIYECNGKFFYSINGYSFSVGDVFPFDCSRIIAIYKQSLLTDLGAYYVQSFQSSCSPVKRDNITKDSFGL